LLRLSESGGRFLRPNRPADDVWFSRDVAAIASARGLQDVAPFFVDAERAPGDVDTYPIGGVTVVQFRNMHAVYALTWFALAGLAGFGAWRVARERAERVSA
jgi:surfeit locus 1 family protein